jgi:hypothetical protein
MKLFYCRHIFEKYSDIKFHENLSSVIRVVSCGRTDSQTWRAKSRFWQFGGSAYKQTKLTLYNGECVFRREHNNWSLLLEPPNALLHFTTMHYHTSPQCTITLHHNALLHFTTMHYHSSPLIHCLSFKMCKTFKIFKKKPLLHVSVGKRPSSGS